MGHQLRVKVHLACKRVRVHKIGAKRKSWEFGGVALCGWRSFKTVVGDKPRRYILHFSISFPSHQSPIAICHSLPFSAWQKPHLPKSSKFAEIGKFGKANLPVSQN